MSRTLSPTSPTTRWGLIARTISNWNEDNALRLAAAMACYVILAMAPMLVIFIRVLGFIFRDKTDEIVRAQLAQLVGPAGGEAIGAMIKGAHQNGGGTLATTVSFVIVLVSASGVFISLQDALNTIWEVKVKPDAGWGHWLQKRFLSIGMVFGIAILLLCSMALTALLSPMINWIFGADRTGVLARAGAYGLDFVVTVGVSMVLFIGVFKFLPDVKISWRDVWRGALVTSVLFKLGQIALAVYFHFGSSTSAYGAFGSLVAVLLWAYYSSAILFFGAEFTQVWARAHGRVIEPEKHAEPMTVDDRVQEGISTTKDDDPESLIKTTPSLPVGYLRPEIVHDTNHHEAYVAGAISAIAAGVATFFLARRDTTTHQSVAAVLLKQRMDAMESKLGRAARMKRYLDQVDVCDRLDRVEKTIRHASRAARVRR